MGIASLGSGSRGNGTLVALNCGVASNCGGQQTESPQPPTSELIIEDAALGDSANGTASGEVVFLVDCGFNVKQTEQRLKRLGLSGGDITAILVTHEHADHMSGVAALSHKYSIPVYASHGTVKKSGLKANVFDGDCVFELSGVTINPVRVPHDAREPTQFVLSTHDERVGVLSDLGCVTQHVVEQFRGCDYLLLEANHDRDQLFNGSYPPALKRRVGADYGHLSNEQSAALLNQIAHAQLNVMIGHVSEQNNNEAALQKTFASFHDKVATFGIATQREGFDWIGQRPMHRQTLGSQQANFDEIFAV